MRLIMLTRAMESSAEVLPALSLLAHHVRTMPAEPTALLQAPACDALIVDGRRDLPAVRGLTRLLRQTGVDVPLILITTEGGLAAVQWDWGMDEVLLDTSSPAEVEARLRLAIARVSDTVAPVAGEPEEIRSGELHIDEATYTVRLRTRALDLTFKEFELLKFLAQHPGRVFSREQLLDAVWGTRVGFSLAPCSCRKCGATTISVVLVPSMCTSDDFAPSSVPSTRPSSAPFATSATDSFLTSLSRPTTPSQFLRTR